MDTLARGDRVRITTAHAGYASTSVLGLTGTIEAVGGGHSTMNGGGHDYRVKLDDSKAARRILAEIRARVQELAEQTGSEFYSEAYIEYASATVSIRTSAESRALEVIR